MTITNDGATILAQLEVEHPAARVLVQLSEMQDKEVGDGTTSVCVLAGEFLRQAAELIEKKMHPQVIILDSSARWPPSPRPTLTLTLTATALPPADRRRGVPSRAHRRARRAR